MINSNRGNFREERIFFFFCLTVLGHHSKETEAGFMTLEHVVKVPWWDRMQRAQTRSVVETTLSACPCIMFYLCRPGSIIPKQCHQLWEADIKTHAPMGYFKSMSWQLILKLNWLLVISSWKNGIWPNFKSLCSLKSADTTQVSEVLKFSLRLKVFS